MPLLYYIINYFISELKDNPDKVIDSIKKYQTDIEAKSDEFIESNMTEYFKNQKIEEENIPLSNNSRDVNPPSGKKEEKKEEKKEDKKEEKKDEMPKEKEKEEIKKEIKEEKKEIKKEEKKEKAEDKKEEKKQEKKNGGNDVQNYDDIVEDIVDIEDIEDLSANKNSGNYNSSQTISQSQGGDNTVDSHLLENYNYVEQNEKK